MIHSLKMLDQDTHNIHRDRNDCGIAQIDVSVIGYKSSLLQMEMEYMTPGEYLE